MIAVDMDGVVTDFCRGFSRMVRQLAVGAPIVSTKDVQSWKWTDWYWPEGYTKKLKAATWRALRRDPHFWRQLSALWKSVV